MKLDEVVTISIAGNHKIVVDGKYVTATWLELEVKNPKLPKCSECKKEPATNESEKCFDCMGFKWFDPRTHRLKQSRQAI